MVFRRGAAATPGGDSRLGSVTQTANSAPSVCEEETEDAQRTFSLAILVSAVRCTLTYVIFPFVLPFAGLAGIGPVIGVIVSVIAVVANVSSIRRMHAAQHRWRVPVSIINVAMIILVITLLVIDVFDLVG